MMTLAIISGIFIAVAFYLISIYNSLVRLRNQVREAFSGMDVQMKKRYELIPNLVETVKAYASHEANTLQKVIEARNSAMQAKNIDEKIQSESMFTSTLKSLFALSEAYPELKANSNFIELQDELSETEDTIAMSRNYYNGTVRMFNNKMEVFPNNLIATRFGFELEEFFELDDMAARDAVKVDFSS